MTLTYQPPTATGLLLNHDVFIEGPLSAVAIVDVSYQITNAHCLGKRDPNCEAETTWQVERIHSLWLVGPAKLSGPSFRCFEITAKLPWLVDVVRDALVDADVELDCVADYESQKS